MGSLLDPKTSIFGGPGGHFGGLGVHFGDLRVHFGGPGRPLDARGDVWGQISVCCPFLMDFGCPWGSLWSHFGDFF